MATFKDIVLSDWKALEQRIHLTSELAIDSHTLTIPDVVAAARHVGVKIILAPKAINLVAGSSDIIPKKLAEGAVIYGVNTGFGGCADTRTKEVIDLQQSFFSHLMYGTLNGTNPASKGSLSNGTHRTTNGTTNGTVNGTKKGIILPLNDASTATCMPESWARAAMVIRLNSLAGGASGIRVRIAESLTELLNNQIAPRIPLRGSISASGDLSPLSYVGALMQGKPSMTAFARDRQTGEKKITRADVALSEKNIEPVKIMAKEGLALCNGTAVSAAVAALALHESQNLAAFSQVLTAMSVEALLGTDESFEPFIAKIRPHPGQIDTAHNVFEFLQDSKLVARNDEDRLAVGELRQDRYSIRTASQWVGPVLEDFILAREQITVELNSVTDNPLIDASTGRIYHGGNFQAKSLTSAVEKLRQGLQSIGKMLFSQGSELMNPVMSRGLPPNLVFDEPSVSYLFQGIDIGMAALTSELGFLANPVGSHVQSAEKGNQAINSLALISARYTLDAVDIVSQISASHLLALCQALDLRAMHQQFQDKLLAIVQELVESKIPGEDYRFLLHTFLRSCERHSALDSDHQFRTAAEEIQPQLLKFLPRPGFDVADVKAFSAKLHERAIEALHRTKTTYISDSHGAATPYLGRAAKRMYQFVRKDLGIPFLCEKLVQGMVTPLDTEDIAASVGGYQTRIYEAIRTGRLYGVVIRCFEDVA